MTFLFLAMPQQRVFLMHHVDFNEIGTQRFQAAAGAQGDLAVGGTLDGGELPGLDLKHGDAAPWMQYDEVGTARLGPDRDIAPAEVIVFQQLFQPLGKAPLAECIELALRANRDKARHLYLPW